MNLVFHISEDGSEIASVINSLFYDGASVSDAQSERNFRYRGSVLWNNLYKNQSRNDGVSVLKEG